MPQGLLAVAAFLLALQLSAAQESLDLPEYDDGTEPLIEGRVLT